MVESAVRRRHPTQRANRLAGWPALRPAIRTSVLTAGPWLAPLLAALLVAGVLVQHLVPLRLALPVVVILLVLAVRPTPATAIGLALLAIPFTGLLRRVTGGPSAFVADDPLALLVIVAALPALVVLLTSGRTARRSAASVVYLAYLLWVLFTSVVTATGSPVERIIGLALIIVPCGVGYLVATGRVVGAERLTGLGLCGLPLLAAAYAVVQYFQPPSWDLAWLRSVGRDLTSVGVPEPRGFRVWGPMEAPLPLATYLGLGLLALLVVAVTRRGVPGWGLRLLLCGLGVLVLLVAVLLTSVRSVVFALPLLLAVTILLDLLPGARRYGVLLLVVLLGGTAVGVGTLGLGSMGAQDGRYSIGSLSQDTSFKERQNLLPQFLDAAVNPVGTGAGTSGIAQRLSANGVPKSVDNGYLTLVLDGGVIRLLLFLGLIALAVTRAARTARANPNDSIAILGILVILYFVLLNTSADVVSGAPSLIFWIFVGAAVHGPAGGDPPPGPSTHGRRPADLGLLRRRPARG